MQISDGSIVSMGLAMAMAIMHYIRLLLHRDHVERYMSSISFTIYIHLLHLNALQIS